MRGVVGQMRGMVGQVIWQVNGVVVVFLYFSCAPYSTVLKVVYVELHQSRALYLLIGALTVTVTANKVKQWHFIWLSY